MANTTKQKTFKKILKKLDIENNALFQSYSAFDKNVVIDSALTLYNKYDKMASPRGNQVRRLLIDKANDFGKNQQNYVENFISFCHDMTSGYLYEVDTADNNKPIDNSKNKDDKKYQDIKGEFDKYLENSKKMMEFYAQIPLFSKFGENCKDETLKACITSIYGEIIGNFKETQESIQSIQKEITSVNDIKDMPKAFQILNMNLDAYKLDRLQYLNGLTSKQLLEVTETSILSMFTHITSMTEINKFTSMTEISEFTKIFGATVSGTSEWSMSSEFKTKFKSFTLAEQIEFLKIVSQSQVLERNNIQINTTETLIKSRTKKTTTTTTQTTVIPTALEIGSIKEDQLLANMENVFNSMFDRLYDAKFDKILVPNKTDKAPNLMTFIEELAGDIVLNGERSFPLDDKKFNADMLTKKINDYFEQEKKQTRIDFTDDVVKNERLNNLEQQQEKTLKELSTNLVHCQNVLNIAVDMRNKAHAIDEQIGHQHYASMVNSLKVNSDVKDQFNKLSEQLFKTASHSIYATGKDKFYTDANELDKDIVKGANKNDKTPLHSEEYNKVLEINETVKKQIEQIDQVANLTQDEKSERISSAIERAERQLKPIQAKIELDVTVIENRSLKKTDVHYTNKFQKSFATLSRANTKQYLRNGVLGAVASVGVGAAAVASAFAFPGFFGAFLGTTMVTVPLFGGIAAIAAGTALVTGVVRSARGKRIVLNKVESLSEIDQLYLQYCETKNRQLELAKVKDQEIANLELKGKNSDSLIKLQSDLKSQIRATKNDKVKLKDEILPLNNNLTFLKNAQTKLEIKLAAQRSELMVYNDVISKLQNSMKNDSSNSNELNKLKVEYEKLKNDKEIEINKNFYLLKAAIIQKESKQSEINKIVNSLQDCDQNIEQMKEQLQDVESKIVVDYTNKDIKQAKKELEKLIEDQKELDIHQQSIKDKVSQLIKENKEKLNTNKDMVPDQYALNANGELKQYDATKKHSVAQEKKAVERMAYATMEEIELGLASGKLTDDEFMKAAADFANESQTIKQRDLKAGKKGTHHTTAQQKYEDLYNKDNNQGQTM